VKISYKEDAHICRINFATQMEQNLHETTSRWKTYGKWLFSEDLEVRDEAPITEEALPLWCCDHRDQGRELRITSIPSLFTIAGHLSVPTDWSSTWARPHYILSSFVLWNLELCQARAMARMAQCCKPERYHALLAMEWRGTALWPSARVLRVSSALLLDERLHLSLDTCDLFIY
jgi:hypothetical protein